MKDHMIYVQIIGVILIFLAFCLNLYSMGYNKARDNRDKYWKNFMEEKGFVPSGFWEDISKEVDKIVSEGNIPYTESDKSILYFGRNIGDPNAKLVSIDPNYSGQVTYQKMLDSSIAVVKGHTAIGMDYVNKQVVIGHHRAENIPDGLPKSIKDNAGNNHIVGYVPESKENKK